MALFKEGFIIMVNGCSEVDKSVYPLLAAELHLVWRVLFIKVTLMESFKLASPRIDKLQVTFHELEQTPFEIGEHVHLTKELLTNCKSIEWQIYLE
ncbi:hypothetical protein IEQ34_023159 [Dendrobium chrysotoxum]|uniref:Uncharacterized protein n=1 Tax=Dendrobium chrysotoxum TaxID=161865 RepID=A0AAV7G0X6_DENCH|nr:hypothetical protein IEQ34_023159 [Dendrobium chrysotoxum]